MKEKIKIVLADDEILFRKGVSFLLDREDNFEIIFEVSNGEELVSFLKESTIHPDIILMDLKMPLLNGVEATRIIQNEFPAIKIIALTSYDSKLFIVNMINTGAASYLVKNATPAQMIATINEVYEKGVFYSEEVIKILQESSVVNTTSQHKSLFDEDYLTKREKEVLLLICKQLSTPEIAEKLFISPRTVEGHRNNLLLKTESKNVAGLVVYAIQNKVVTVDDLDF